ncbi:uncharacterized protein BCR38DRAFT_9821 [Pseudomassariella vexata]|uniref:Fucose-specific lectin n=1 Tax=Pseudomassariella vexata TaxID=1141098 RepID=A0A1Y2EIK1_9PEZI|nr:uncharacterized protein BCR38DRAFT_9821 [Pseudomassariella vexata]ORY71400.1 hypothetical protein BCR38DRAFT_9821 [Pseudomassariella vexata]
MSGNGIYSTLEVAGSEIVEKFIVVPPEESPVKSKMAGSSREANLPQVDYNKSLPELVQSRDEDLPEALLGQRSHAKPWTLECAASDITENEKTIWGLKRRRFYMVVVVVLFVAVAIAIGGGIGGTIWRNGSRGNIPADPSVKVHSSSKLAAANWTDPLGTEYYAVFWQASSADLMVSLWCSTSNWTVSNISTSVSVSAINGTPLAAAARGYPYTSLSLGGFGVTLFYLSPEHTVEQLYTTDFELGNWTKGTLSEAGVKWTANPSSQLAVWWSLCGTGCTGNLRVLYQDDQQTLRSLNSSNWGNATSVKAELGVGAGITITGLTVNYDQTWEGHSTQRLYYHDAGMVQEVGWGDEGNAEDVISVPFPWVLPSRRLFCRRPRFHETLGRGGGISY